jgi:hypothetical protein
LRLRKGKTPHIPYERQLRTWIAWYERVWPVRDQIVVAPFEVVTEDFGAVIDAVNDKFRTDFARFEHADEQVEAIRSSYGYHALPTEERARLKEQARARFEQALGPDAAVVEEARALCRRYRTYSSPQF